MAAGKKEVDGHSYQGDGTGGGAQGKRERPPVAAMEKGPGPAVYKLPQSVVYESHTSDRHRAPAWTFKGKYGKLNDDASPGPKYGYGDNLTNKGIQRARSCNVTGRNKDMKNLMSDTPGPGSNAPSIDYLSYKRRAPNWSMGNRTNFKLGDNNPAPNSYGLPELIGSTIPNKSNSASYSFHTRNKQGAPQEDLGRTPGPAAYSSIDNNYVFNKKPQWSMGGRPRPMSSQMSSPGPNQYASRNTDNYNNKRAAPKFHMGIKHSEFCMPLVIDAID